MVVILAVITEVDHARLHDHCQNYRWVSKKSVDQVLQSNLYGTNKLRLPLLVAVDVLSSGSTFPVTFSYCHCESAESLGFVWQAIKEECFIGDIPGPRVMLGDWAGGLIASVPKALPWGALSRL